MCFTYCTTFIALYDIRHSGQWNVHYGVALHCNKQVLRYRKFLKNRNAGYKEHTIILYTTVVDSKKIYCGLCHDVCIYSVDTTWYYTRNQARTKQHSWHYATAVIR